MEKNEKKNSKKKEGIINESHGKETLKQTKIIQKDNEHEQIKNHGIINP